MAQKDLGYTTTKECRIAQCPTAKIVLEPSDNGIHVDFEWLRELPLNKTCDSIDSLVSIIAKESLQVSCYHVPNNIGMLMKVKASNQDDYDNIISYCKTCRIGYMYEKPSREAPQAVYGILRSFEIDSTEDIYDSEWLDHLDPHNVGFFSDSMWKHVAWCNDNTCATSNALLRLNILWNSGKSTLNSLRDLTNAEDLVARLDVAYELLLQGK